MAAPLHATLDQARQAPIPAEFRSAEHRFESFSADFGTWVVFDGPKGGEHG
jgi:hypothetical protein